MNFLQASEILIPALTNLSVTIYTGKQQTLQDFEDHHCFSTTVQNAFTKQSLEAFFANHSDKIIYDITVPWGIQLAIFNIGGPWVLLGPYVTTTWHDKITDSQLSEDCLEAYKIYYQCLPILTAENVHKIAFLIREHTVGNGFSAPICAIKTEASAGKLGSVILESHVNSDIINQNYEWENSFLQKIHDGDTQKALEMLRHADFRKDAKHFGVRFASDELKDQIAMYASLRTLVRKSAEAAGLLPIVVDEISQKYAIQMQHATSVEKLQSLTESLVAEFCDMIYDQRHSSYSYEVKKALQTIELNLGQPLSTARLAALSGVSSNYFGKKFCRETGMTVKQYITKRRCEVSARLLTDSKISIQEIAAYVGFPDASYFARVFKKENGVSPQAFRSSANFL